ncbi:hypothetical protein [Tenacibaculum aiptasiae]|uniref:hypothetical protein n=1 Tax=Tenacibaculum aiptasiae TaxID=426481 RepID=UPI00232E1EA8|nr:hypothetical protein [Tenacibaculum aiptasiae]
MKFKFTYILILFSFFSCKNDPICTINENNAGKEIYDLDEATCFIALKLQKKKSNLNLIRDALIAEENYMSKIRLLSKNPDSKNKSNAYLDINELVKYAIHKEKINLTKDHLLEIYNIEIEYLKFIGVLDE